MYDEIVESVKKLIKKYHERDPVRLCGDMEIKLIFLPLGTSEDAIKGFFLEARRIKTITINSDLPQIIQKLIICHEIGHAVLHHKAVHAFHEVGLFDESSVYEQEANLFAAEFMLDDDEVTEALNGDSTFFSAAATLRVPIELLDFKFRIMKWKGYKLAEPPIIANNKFLSNLEIPYETDDYGC